ncbi:MAG: DUF6515 family protein [Rhodocyclaceae bacterium]
MRSVRHALPAPVALTGAILFAALTAAAPLANADDAVRPPDNRPSFRSEGRNDVRSERRGAQQAAQNEQRDARSDERDSRRTFRDNRRDTPEAAQPDPRRGDRRQGDFRQDSRQDRREVSRDARDSRPPARAEFQQGTRRDGRDDARVYRDQWRNDRPRTDAEMHYFGGDERGDNRNGFRQDRHVDNRHYPRRGTVIGALPHEHRVITYRSTRYYFDDGVWYRPFGASFMVIAPPIGIFVPILPLGYITMQIGGNAYYVANDVYYARRGDGYVVVEPPAGIADYRSDDYSAGQDQIFIYPRKGQSEAQQARDRYECHAWARDQTGFDPTRQMLDMSSDRIEALRSDYHRAMGACLDARGYTVR